MQTSLGPGTDSQEAFGIIGASNICVLVSGRVCLAVKMLYFARVNKCETLNGKEFGFWC